MWLRRIVLCLILSDWRSTCQKLQQSAGVFECTKSSLLELKGEEALSYLHSQTTQDIFKLSIGEGTSSAILDRLAKIQSLFNVYRLGNSLWLTIHQDQKQAVIDSIEKNHISESFEIIDHSSTFSLLALEGPLSFGILKLGLDQPIVFENNHVYQAKLFRHDVALFSESFFGDRGVLIAVANHECDQLKQKLLSVIENKEVIEVDEQCQRIMRLEAGNIQFGSELFKEHILPGTGLEETHVDYDKGCYVGQEVVARIRTYGKAPRFIIGGIYEGVISEDTVNTGALLDKAGKEIGEVLAHYPSPQSENKHHFILLLKKNLDVNESTIIATFASHELQITLQTLPFSNPKLKQEKAQQYYEEALKHFSEASSQEMDQNQEDNLAIQLLRKSINLDPGFDDAYEVLGVLLGRQERYDEAIEHMKSLSLVDPSSIMAHSNLSLYYMKKGDIETAEKYKADATALSFKSAAALAKQNRNANELEQQERQDAERKKAMFEEVLSIDPKDIPALYGLGQCYYILKEYEKSVPYLNEAITIKSDYSVAYLSLAKCYKELKQIDRALSILSKGIEAAEKRGDLMPLKEMQQIEYQLKQN